MTLAYAGGDPNQIQQIAYKTSSTWADVAMRILNQYGLYGIVVILLGVVIILLLWKGRK